MFLQEVAPCESIVLHCVGARCESAPEVLPCDQKDRNKGNNSQRQYWAEQEHGCQCETGRQEHAQNRRQEVRPEIRDFFDRFFEGIHHTANRRVLVVVGGERVEVPQQAHPQREAHFLGCAQHQVAAQAGECHPALVT
jgi:hypothetical protein